MRHGQSCLYNSFLGSSHGAAACACSPNQLIQDSWRMAPVHFVVDTARSEEPGEPVSHPSIGEGVASAAQLCPLHLMIVC